MVLLQVTPGHFNALMDDFRSNIVPIWESERSAGLLVTFDMFLNTKRSGSDDWDIGYSLIFRNMAALDGLPDKVYGIHVKQYGDSSAEQKVNDKRVENAHVVSRMLIRDITLW